MSVMKGYKETEIGVLPEEWEVKTLNSKLKQNPVYGIGAAAIPYNDAFPVYLRITDISDDGSFIKENKTSVNHSLARNYFLNENQIVIARTGASVGKSYLYNNIDGELVFAGFLIMIEPNKDQLEPFFLYSLLKTNYYWKWIETNSSRSGQPGINAVQLKSLLIPIPPKPEQTAIATALRDIDNLITTTQALIAKKKAIKTATMQQLLRPQDDWVEMKLGHVLKIRHGKNQRQIETSDGIYPILASGGIIGYTNTYLYDKPSVLIGRKGTIDKPKYMDTPFWSIDTIYYSEIFEEAHPKFIYYKFQLIEWYKYNEASGVPSLNSKIIENINIWLPKTKIQQIKISSVIDEISLEIENLEATLTKYQSIKQDMMQNLLTGKIRLV